MKIINMITNFTRLCPALPGFSWLTGPIFEKELRVSSRRKRNYFLRFTYLSLLTIFVASVWIITTKKGGATSQIYQISRMSEAGKYIITTIVWFQFVTIQLIAAVMLSTAINEEIYHRTLGVLMTAPISSLQIVVGKLLSKLLQLMLLLGISLPLLAIIRVFGGVPWDYVMSSFCITFTAAIFTGAVSFIFSIYNREAYLVILRTIFICFLFYITPLIILQLFQVIYRVSLLPRPALFYINPFIAMNTTTRNMLSSSTAVQSWVLHCTTMLGLSAFLLTLSTICVRRAGRRQVTGQAGLFGTRKERRLAYAGRRARISRSTASKKIRYVKGPPIIWRALITPVVKTGRFMTILRDIIIALILIFAYGFCIDTDCLGSKEVQIGFILAYFGMGLLRTATCSATSITSEKEARTWPILLTTPLAGKKIALDKILGSFLRAWLFWILLAFHTIVFTLAGYIPAAAILPCTLLVISSALLVSAVGVLFSSCFRHSSSSATVNLIFFFCFTVPVCCPLPVFVASPLFILVMVLAITGGWGEITGELVFPFRMSVTSSGTWLWRFVLSQLAFLVPVVVYLLLAFAAFALATGRIRRRVF